MRHFLLAVSFFILFFDASAQNTTADQVSKSAENNFGTWKRGGMASLTLSQGGTRNWAPGGDRFTLASNVFLRLFANHSKGRMHWDNTVDLNYGLLNSNSFGIVKNDDKLDFVSRLNWAIGNLETSRIRLGAWFNFRTQLADGYDYDGESPRRISAFFAPAIPTISLGINYYSRDRTFNVHAGPHARWIIVANRPFELAANYGVDPEREVKIQAGLMASVAYNNEIIRNVTYQSRLDLFSDAVQKEPGNVDIFWTNMFYLKVNRYFGVIYNFDLQYDDDTQPFGYEKNRPGTQLKSIMGIGLSVKF